MLTHFIILYELQLPLFENLHLSLFANLHKQSSTTMSSTPNPKVNIPHADIPKAVPPRSRVPLMLGLAGAGALGYYFYSAGGDPNVAKKTVQCMQLLLRCFLHEYISDWCC